MIVLTDTGFTRADPSVLGAADARMAARWASGLVILKSAGENGIA